MSEPEWLTEKNRRWEHNPITFDVLVRIIPPMVQAYCNAPQYTNALEMAYRKFVLEDDSIGTSELSDLLADALSEAMGPTAFVRWLAEVTESYEPRDELP